jgi:wyosine [tRNA(Phe)-imidazoG37] synthetase (radical SAM superfamily)
VLEGVLEFAKVFEGALASETMLVRGFNTDPRELERIAEFLKELRPDKAYISIPVRPPAKPYAKPPTEAEAVEAYAIFARALSSARLELLSTLEPPQLEARGDPAGWLLAVTSVHPLKRAQARPPSRGSNAPPSALRVRGACGQALRVHFNGQ